MFRLSIRDLLWLMVVVVIGVCWWQEYRHRGPENARLRAEKVRLTELNRETTKLWKDAHRAWISVVETRP
jgi:hypothetical protein